MIVAAVAAVAGIAVWLILHFEGSGAGGKASSSSTDVSARSLVALAASLGRPVYWAGPEDGVTYEFTETADRRVYVRYLPKGVAAGTTKPFLTVASYPVAHAFTITRKAAARSDAVRLRVGGGGVGFYSRARPTNVYVAFPHANVQIEVYDPAPAAAQKLVAAARIHPVAAVAAGAVVRTHPAAATRAGLKQLAATLGRPIYWLGQIEGTTLELTRTPDGRIYIRYLPAGVAPGSSAPALTVATYPAADGLAATTAAARKPDGIRIPLPHGAVAFFARRRPTNVYVAFPGVREQIEVFDPSTRRVRALVAANRLTPVS